MADRDRDNAVLQSDAAFEKWLLDAAGADGPPPGAAAAAWAQFKEAAGGALPREAEPFSGSPRSGMGQSRPAPGSGAPASSPTASSPTARASDVSAAKWIGVGAVGGAILGGLLTAFVLRGAIGGEVARDPARAESLAASTAGAPAPTASGARDLELVVPAPSALPPASGVQGNEPDDDGVSQARRSRVESRVEPLPRAARAPLQRGGRRARVLPLPAAAGDTVASRPVSSLEREVALLDAIRVANANGDFARGIELVARYRGEFADGELARDADVFELEALAGEGERARVAQAARAFLGRYPGDPHTQRVRALAAGSR